MNAETEGEILLKEKYGTSANTVLYVKPPEQSSVVTVEKGSVLTLCSWFGQIFLPHGYPDSVSKDYTAYQLWDTAQAFCSTITGTLATQEVLKGVGVGKAGATPLAATTTWVIKDGCGHLGRILFAYTHGTQLDAYSKKWRLYADTLNDAAMCIEIALPLFTDFTLFALCVSTAMKAIVGVAGGATRAAMTQHHAIRGNMADVSAKDAAQETAVNLIASFAALFLISSFGNSLLLFLLMIVLHISFNYMAVRAVCLRTLNEARYLQLIDAYLKHEVITAPCEINRQEPIVFYQMGSKIFDLRLSGFRIKLGCSLKDVNIKQSATLRKIQQAYADRNYLLYPHVARREMYVLLREEATNEDILLAYLHAVLLAIIVCTLNNDHLLMYKYGEIETPFAQVCRTLVESEWAREPAETGPGFKYRPSLELITFVDKMVQNEWPKIKMGLSRTGWDLSKHLLLVDEWRVESYETKQDIEELEEFRVPRDKKPDTRISDTPSTLIDIKLPTIKQARTHKDEVWVIEPSISENVSEQTLRPSSDENIKNQASKSETKLENRSRAVANEDNAKTS